MIQHSFYIEDTSVRAVKDFTTPSGIEIYEVVRVMDGVPLFLEDHLIRFYRSAWLCHLEIPLREETIGRLLRELTAVNGVKEGNIRFSWCWRPSGKFRAYFVPHKYPSEEDYRQGVACGVLQAERSDPNAKVVQAGLREEADRMIREEGWYEVLLVNRKGLLTEGSRSNLFFIREGIVRTAPDEEVLPGITRQKVLELIRKENFPLETRSLAFEELPHAEAAFLTGTSPRVLLVRNAGNLSFTPGHPMVTRLAEGYDALIADYLNQHR
jgi:branched-chain amino acid aminotransferase